MRVTYIVDGSWFGSSTHMHGAVIGYYENTLDSEQNYSQAIAYFGQTPWYNGVVLVEKLSEVIHVRTGMWYTSLRIDNLGELPRLTRDLGVTQ